MESSSGSLRSLLPGDAAAKHGTRRRGAQVSRPGGIYGDMKADDRVRLLEPQPDLPVGAVGVVIGFCPTSEGEGVAVRFDGDGRVVAPESLELVEPASAM
jgi:hypothetical protein